MRRGAARKAGLLITTVYVISSGLGFLLLAVMARWLTPEQNGQFLVLWALVFGIGATLSAIDAECSRLAARAALEKSAVSGQVGLVAAVGGVGGLLLVVILVLAPGVGAIMVSSTGVVIWTVVAVLLFAPLSLARGVLIGTGRVGWFAWVVLGEALFRVLLGVGLWLSATHGSLSGAVAAIAVGGLASVPVVRIVRRSVRWRSPDRSLRAAGRAVGALGSANGLSTLLLAGYPVLVATLVGSTRGLETLFAAVVLTRLPLVAITPLQAVAVPLATRAIHGGHQRSLRRTWARAAWALVGVVLGAVALGWYLGPATIGVFQGPGYEASPALMATLLAASCVLAAALPQLSVMIAADRHTWVTASWAIAVLATATWLLLGVGGAETRGTVAYAIGALVVFAASAIGFFRAIKVSADRP